MSHKYQACVMFKTMSYFLGHTHINTYR